MTSTREELLILVDEIVGENSDRKDRARRLAALVRDSADYFWTGIYDIDSKAKRAMLLAWSGPSAPTHVAFDATKGLTGAAVASRQVVNVGDVSRDQRYLTAFSSTRSEMIVPVIAPDSGEVVGTIDVVSELLNAFPEHEEAFLRECGQRAVKLWSNR